MNRHLKVSLTLAALSLTTVGLLTGCNNAEPVDNSAVEQEQTQAAIRNAIAKAESELAAAKTELQAVIASGDTATTQQLTDAISNLNSAIETAKKLAADNDTAIKAELLASIEAAKVAAIDASTSTLRTAIEELEGAIVAGDLATTESVTKAIATFNETVEATKKLATDSDAAMKTELLAAIEASKKDAAELVSKQVETETKKLTDLTNKNYADVKADVEKQVQTLTNSIEAAKQLALGSDVAMREELEAAINASKVEATNAIAAAVKKTSEELTAKITASETATLAEINNAYKTLDASIKAAEKLAVDGDALVKTELLAAIEASKKGVEENFSAALALLETKLDAEIKKAAGDSADALADVVADFTDIVGELEKYVDDADATLETELRDEMADMKAEVIAMISDEVSKLAKTVDENLTAGLNASAEELAKQVTLLNTAIESAKKIAADDDVALKAELRAEIQAAQDSVKDIAARALDAAVAELNGKIEDRYNLSSEAIARVVADTQTLIAETRAMAVTADNNVKAELEAKIEAAVASLTASLEQRLGEVKDELVTKIEEADGEITASVTKAVEDMNALVEAAKTVAAEADSALEAKLLNKIDEVQTSVLGVVDEKINALREEIANAMNDSNQTIIETFDAFYITLESYSTLFAESDESLKTELTQAIADAKAEVLATVDTKLADLKVELEGKITASADELTTKLEAYKALVDQLDVAYKDADGALKAELEQKIADEKTALIEIATGMLADTKTELEGMIDTASKKQADDLAGVKADLEDQIAAVKAITDGIIADYATTESVVAAVATLKTELTEALDAVKEAGILLEEWDVATDAIVGTDGAMKRIKAIYDEYKSKKNTYVNGDFAKIDDLYDDYRIKLLRVTDADLIDAIIAEFDEEAAKVRTIPDAIYDALMLVGKSVDEVEYDADKEGLDAVKALLDHADTLGNAEVSANILAYGEDEINLVELYESYMDQYNALLRKSDGKGIKDRMDALTSQTIVITDNEEDPTSFKFMIVSIRQDYNTWISDANNSLDNVEGFAESYAKFVEAEARYSALIAAKAEAEQINKTIEKLFDEITASGATIQNKEALTLLNNRVLLWTDVYFAGQYSTEIGVSSNYELVDHEALDELNKLFEAKVAAFKEAAIKFANKVDAIGEVNLMSWDEINEALAEYGNLVLSRDLNDFEYLFDAESTPAKYYNKLVSIYAEYRTLKTSAYNDYLAAFGDVDGLVVNIYDADKVAGIVSWYQTYGVFDENGAITFDNGAVGTGYVLNSSLTVDADDYAAIARLKADYDALVTAKNAEVEDLIAKIEGIGNVTFGRGDYIREVRTAFDAYLAGTKAPGEYLDEQFKIDPSKAGYEVTNVDILTEAEAKLADLENQVNNIKNFINGMKDYDGYSDFVDADDRDTFERYLNIVVGMMDKFQEANSGSLENAFTAEELAKVETAKLAIVKYDNTVAIIKDAAAYVEVVSGLKLPAEDIDASALAANTVRDDIAADIDAATSAEEVAAFKALADAKFAELKECLMVYEQYLAALMNDATIEETVRTELGFKMSLSYVTTINRVVSVDNVEDVEQSAKFVADELESLYPLG